jgi:hypothetical protein
MGDPAKPDRLLPAYDSGDHLHPSLEGYRVMATVGPAGAVRPMKAAAALTGDRRAVRDAGSSPSRRRSRSRSPSTTCPRIAPCRPASTRVGYRRGLPGGAEGRQDRSGLWLRQRRPVGARVGLGRRAVDVARRRPPAGQPHLDAPQPGADGPGRVRGRGGAQRAVAGATGRGLGLALAALSRSCPRARRWRSAPPCGPC